MKEKIAWLGWIFFIFLLSLSTAKFFLFDEYFRKNDTWEYKILIRLNMEDHSSKKSIDELNNLGKEGWELVTQEESEIPGTHTLIFKRRN